MADQQPPQAATSTQPSPHNNRNHRHKHRHHKRHKQQQPNGVESPNGESHHEAASVEHIASQPTPPAAPQAEMRTNVHSTKTPSHVTQREQQHDSLNHRHNKSYRDNRDKHEHQERPDRTAHPDVSKEQREQKEQPHKENRHRDNSHDERRDGRHRNQRPQPNNDAAIDPAASQDQSSAPHQPRNERAERIEQKARSERPQRFERSERGDKPERHFGNRTDARPDKPSESSPEDHTDTRPERRTQGRSEGRSEGRPEGRPDSPIMAYYTRRAMFSDYGGQGGYEEDEEPTSVEEKEELVFEPAKTIGAPGMNLDQPNLYTGARGAAIRILSRVERSDTYLDRALEHELEYSDLNALDRALLTELVHGVLRWQSKLDWVLTGFYHGEFVKCITPVKNAMRIALYQVMFLTKIPPFAAVNESVELIKRLKGARSANLVNAVLRNILHNINNIRYPIRDQDPTRYLSIMYGHPSWLVRRWLQRFGEEQTEQLLKMNNERPKVALRLSPLQGSREDLAKYLDDQQIKQWESPYDERFILVGSLSAVREWESFQSGWFSVQDPSAAMVVRLAHPQAGQTVLDLCSAPGGKATFAAELMQNQGRVIALDKYDGKLDIVRENAQRLRLTCIETRSADARTVSPFDALSTAAAQEQSQREQVALEQAARAEQERRDGKNKKSRRDKNEKFFERREEKPVVKTIPPEELADIVFVDAPCSGTGTLAKKPDIRWKLDTDSFPALTKLQRDILRNATELVKVGGILVYSTCTIEPEENMGTAQWFLEHFPHFELERAEEFLPESVCADGFMQTFPHVHKTDGAFAARFVRKS
jgi:16S rRNA (cytosine967-C5)-methyltransferase